MLLLLRYCSWYQQLLLVPMLLLLAAVAVAGTNVATIACNVATVWYQCCYSNVATIAAVAVAGTNVATIADVAVAGTNVATIALL